MAQKINKDKYRIDFKYNLSEYWELLKGNRHLFFGIMFLTLLMSGLSVLEKFLFKVIVDNGADFFSGVLLIDAYVKILLFVVVVFITANCIETLSDWFNIHFLILIDLRTELTIKRKYFNHIIGLDHNFHTTHKTGSMISRLSRGTGAVESMSDTLTMNFAPLIFQLIVVSASLALFSWVPALVLLITVTTFLSYSFYIQHIQKEYKVAANRKEDYEKGFISDIFTNIDSIKYFGKEELIKKKFSQITERTKNARTRYENFFPWFESGQALILAVGTFFLIYFPLMQFLRGEITIGTLVFIYTVFGNVVSPMFGFVWGMRRFYKSMADFQELFDYGKIQNQVKDRGDAKELKVQKGEIEFRNVGFKYGKRKIFEKFNLKVKPNEKIALVGHSGCGKTTLIKLLYRLHDVNQGEILVDNKDIEEFKQESLRSGFSIVPQECILFDDTIFNNVAFSNPHADRKDVLRAMKLAQLDKIVQNFPKKENTIVGERGVKLSGGEKQRVSIARAILANKKILVLDEATSSLDSETEHEIQKDLQKLLEGRTSIIIAHRLSTIMGADRIIVMKGGKIVQEGKHSELIRVPGEYKHLWNLQKGGYIK